MTVGSFSLTVIGEFSVNNPRVFVILVTRVFAVDLNENRKLSLDFLNAVGDIVGPCNINNLNLIDRITEMKDNNLLQISLVL